jgi:DNA-binding PadR family transcriptional regulator
VTRLTTTSYALLCLLAVQPWSAYELAGQMRRSMRFAWPRAQTRIYQEPKNLVAHGLATASIEATGRRTRTVYTITPEGRRALHQWLDQPSAPPALESEALVRAAFAEHGSKDALLRTLRGLRHHGQAMHDDALGIIRGYADDGGPFPERLHLNVLVGKFILDYTALLERWASWAEAEVEQWPATGPASGVPVAWSVIHDAADDPG